MSTWAVRLLGGHAGLATAERVDYHTHSLPREDRPGARLPASTPREALVCAALRVVRKDNRLRTRIVRIERTTVTPSHVGLSRSLGDVPSAVEIQRRLKRRLRDLTIPGWSDKTELAVAAARGTGTRREQHGQYQRDHSVDDGQWFLSAAGLCARHRRGGRKR